MYKFKTTERTKLFVITILTFFGFLFNSTFTEGKTLYEKSFSVDSEELLSVKIMSGDIEVSSWDKNEVSIIVTGDEDINEYLDFFFKKTDTGVEVKTEKKSSWSNWSSTPRFKVTAKVPQNFDTELKTSGGDIDAKMLNGKLELATSGGDVSIFDSKGEVLVRTSGGDVKSVNFDGSSTLKTSGGDIIVKNSIGTTEARTSGGDIKLSVSNGKVIGATSGGDVELDYTGNNKGIDLTTSGGDIYLKLPSDFTADISLVSSGGEVKCNCFPIKIKEIKKSRFYGKLNNGGAEVQCKTSGGDIIVENK